MERHLRVYPDGRGWDGSVLESHRIPVVNFKIEMAGVHK